MAIKALTGRSQCPIKHSPISSLNANMCWGGLVGEGLLSTLREETVLPVMETVVLKQCPFLQKVLDL